MSKYVCFTKLKHLIFYFKTEGVFVLQFAYTRESVLEEDKDAVKFTITSHSAFSLT
jgi:hypothetical protein